MKRYLRLGCFLLVVIGCISWFIAVVAGQSPDLALDTFLVELWPEYDRPEVLVISQGAVSPETPLPVQLAIPLPDYIENLHVVAVRQNGVLMEADPDAFELRREAGQLTLMLALSDSRQFHFEYYDPVILTRQADARTINYQLLAPYRVKSATIQIQEPFATQDFSMTPAAENTRLGQDGLRYNDFQVPNFAKADTLALSATYRRSSDQLSTQMLAAESGDTPPAVDVAPAAVSSDDNFGYILIGIGLILLIGATGSWWWSKRKAAQTRPVRRRAKPSPRRKPKPAAQSRPQRPVKSTATQTGGFCYRCGTPLRDDSNFCHHCGAERRRE